LLVSTLLSKTALPNYAIANKIVELPTLGSAIWAKTIYPWISEAEARDAAMGTIVLFLERVFVLSTGVASVLLVLWAPTAIQALFGAKYDAAIPSIRAMASVTSVFMLNNYFLYVLLGKRAETRYVAILAAAT